MVYRIRKSGADHEGEKSADLDSDTIKMPAFITFLPMH